MNYEIGTAAGQIYRYLSRSTSKPHSYTRVRKSVKVDGRTFDMAVGWLAREDKIALEKQGRTLTLITK